MPNPLIATVFLPILASVDFHSPILWAVLVGWVISVTLHELAHGVVAYLGGDYTIRERGGLTLNPFKYMDPLLSIAMPLFFLAQGGVPLMGGATYIRNDLLRSRLWQTAVSLAGPATNFCLFLLCALPFHPKLGWIHFSYFSSVSQMTSTQLFLGAMVVLQFLACLLNLLPIPPIDGFGAIKPYFDERTQALLSTPQVRMGGLIVLWFLLPRSFFDGIYRLEDQTLARLGFDPPTIWLIGEAFNKVLYNQ
jgi:Zn-dependent protease